MESWQAMKAVTRVRTFQFIVLQGLVGSLPWTAFVFLTLWFELIGKLRISDAHSLSVSLLLGDCNKQLFFPAFSLRSMFSMLFLYSLEVVIA